MSATTAPRRPAGRAATAHPWAAPTALLLAAAAGVVDLWAITSLGGAYAGVVTGNLVNVGRTVGDLRPGPAVPPALAVVGFTLGVGVWAVLGRRHPTAVAVPLLGELAVLVAASAVWIATAHRTVAVADLVVLALTSVAMGAQSAVALRLGAATTYMTGTLTTAVAAAAGGAGASRLWALRQPLALVLGAVLAELVLTHARWATPLPALVLVAAALTVSATGDRHAAHTSSTKEAS